jgi:hypothetical protein
MSILDAGYCWRVAGPAAHGWHPAPNSIDDSGGTAHLPS